ncbi:MAG: NAD-dependent deacetylase [Alphaproteobacteria bacterium]|nr:NAD-dependent deacetylase [Alphaproteobacteria bacterium]
MIAEAERIVAFTGAGISTESGIPDFRSPGGLWTRMKPIDFRDFVASADVRREAWRRRFEGKDFLEGVQPNDGHRALAQLIARGQASAIITQNVDGLHQAAGVSGERVIEIHGNASYATCLACGLRHEIAEIREHFLATGDPLDCRTCGGIVKAATISFGQAMPEAEMARAQEEARACDLFLAIGSSLVVYPAAALPALAKRAGAKLVILNREATGLDGEADLVLHAEIGPALRAAIASS